ncbi:asparagine--tRNA ligase [Simkania negevensis]|uniref:Asparagine--tRNA ligase n=1 Tax=Simkania negevensis TaxID=83561 RepID=A0ABS3ASA1_9BACT|nr:asparagine--tRNA ligase [Simkania negevensis]
MTLLQKVERIKIKRIKECADKFLGQEVNIKGWVRTVRKQKVLAFIEINDGSSLSGIQVVLDSAVPDYDELMEVITTGASLSVTGEVKESPGKNQAVEIHASKIELIGVCDPERYPLQKKRHSFEFLRTIAHLRPRTNTLGAVTRVRNALAFATHLFFQERSFYHIHTPIITASDCEGAGQLFHVSTTDENKKDHFFSRPTYLTVSGQLNGEIYACALSDIYTFGPTFRAENSNTSRHLSEFWMIEPEMAFADLSDNVNLAEAYIRYVVKYALDHCQEDLQLFDRFVSKGLLEMLALVAETEYERITYTEAVDLLKKSKKEFEFPVEWGKDLQAEHERYLTEEYFKKPVTVVDYPKEIKAFYMRANDDGKTVAAMDFLVPRVGELVGGSQREERLDAIEERLVAAGLDKEQYWWYLDLRRYGSVPHSGFGVGFERLVQFVTGMDNIRDVIPFPRYPGHADF